MCQILLFILSIFIFNFKPHPKAVERLVELYCLSESSEQARIQFIAEIINDLRNPLEGPTQFDVKNIESCEKVTCCIMTFDILMSQSVHREVLICNFNDQNSL